MTFIIRQITRRPKGQDIIRDRPVEADRLTVGRATGHDIFLADLRVALDHMVIRLSGSRLNIQAQKGRHFLLDGRTVDKATIADGRDRTLQVGPYELRVSRNSNGIWVITVDRVEPEELLNIDDVDEIFTLRGTLLGKRLPSWIGFIAAILFFLALPIGWFVAGTPQMLGDKIDPDASWLAGELSGGHANLEGECEACHQKAFVHVTDGTCLECHEGLGDHAEPSRLTSAMQEAMGFDGALTRTAAFFGREPGQCADCHREHNGEEGVILTTASLCTDCHAGMSDRLADTPLGDASDFAADHPNFSATLVSEPGPEPVWTRVALGSPELRDNSGLKFPHDLHLDGAGGVAAQAAAMEGFGDALVCEDCHTMEKGGLLFEPVTMEASCQMCHSLVFETDGTVERKLPHGEPQQVVAQMREYYRSRAVNEAVGTVSGSGRRRPGGTSDLRTVDRRADLLADAERATNAMVAQIFSPGGACHDCHQVIAPQPGAVDYDILPVHLVDQFMTKAMFNHEKHDVGDLACEDCHDARHSGEAADVLLPGIDAMPGLSVGTEITGCRDCHGGEKAGGDMVPSTCTDCHGYHDGAHAPLMTAGRVKDAGEFGPGRWRRISLAGEVR